MIVSLFRNRKFLDDASLKRGLEFIQFIQKKCSGNVALIGGAAFVWYDSPRMTKGIDIASVDEMNLAPYSPTPLGYGTRWERDGQASISIVSRGDEYRELYHDAVRCAIPGFSGFPVARPEHLAAMKLAIHDLRHRLDLKWLLGRKGLLDREMLRGIVYRFVGGRFAVDALELVEEEVRVDIEADPDRDRNSYP